MAPSATKLVESADQFRSRNALAGLTGLVQGITSGFRSPFDRATTKTWGLTMAHELHSRAAELAPLYDAAFEHDACGVGLVVDIHGRPARDIVTRALAGLVNLTHRGGVGADARTGDGAGILTQIPVGFFAPDLAFGELGVAMTFLPRTRPWQSRRRNSCVCDYRTRPHRIGWRDTPIDPSVLGRVAISTLPRIAQLLISRPASLSEDDFERDLMLARRAAERATAEVGIADFFVVSSSCRTIIYKAFCLPRTWPASTWTCRTRATKVRSSSSTSATQPTRCQPGPWPSHSATWRTTVRSTPSAATVSGCWPALRNWRSRRIARRSPPAAAQPGRQRLPQPGRRGQLLYHGGRSLPHALMMLVPEPWEQLPDMDPARRAFYDFHAGLIEQWDGPAALGFSDGVIAGATLDRNGLRPLRYAITEDGLFVAGSEAGTVDIDQCKVIEKGRLGPGQMIVVDTRRGVVLHNDELKAEVAGRQPYAEWLADISILSCETRNERTPSIDPGREADRVSSAPLATHRRRHPPDRQPDGRRGEGTDVVDGRRRATGRALRAHRAQSTPSSASASPRSPTRRSTRCVSGR